MSEIAVTPAAPTVTYFARSILTSRTAQFATLTVIVGVLSLPEVLALVPLGALPTVMAVVGVINFLLRVITVRPVAWSLPGTVTAVTVEKLIPPAAAVSTD
jgi:hypothetical protein